MRKLKLAIEALEVESFSIADSSGQDGTVHGRASGQCATGPSIDICIGPTYCCNPTANTGCCPPPTDWCPATAYYPSCGVSCPQEDCFL
jgi:hypothetical protein